MIGIIGIIETLAAGAIGAAITLALCTLGWRWTDGNGKWWWKQ